MSSFTEYRHNDTIVKETRTAAPFVCLFVYTPQTEFCEDLVSSADVAQLVEQLIRNQQVIGSSPIVGSI